MTTTSPGASPNCSTRAGSPRSDADRRAVARDANQPARPRLSVVSDALVNDVAVNDTEPDGDPGEEDEATGPALEGVGTGKRAASSGFPVFDAASPDWRF